MKMSRLSVNVLVALSLAVAHHSVRAEMLLRNVPLRSSVARATAPLGRCTLPYSTRRA